MERFVFADHIYKEKIDMIKVMQKADDKKAYIAHEIANELIEDIVNNTNRYMFTIMQITFDIGRNGVGFADMAQFYYDNYSEYQLIGLIKIMKNPDGINIRKEYAGTREEAEALIKRMEEEDMK